ncbi:DoxX family protein (plasmid) [Agrobacterium tumefaciens]|uniref:DoxX family protein n=1 Tax=Agrobacterium tumefaciens TaxID=358 RepID=A0AAJ4N906_AGRTU|nr:DoxX family protein [Agrobacterium tumefaciens]
MFPSNFFAAAGRLLLAIIFIYSGLGKVTSPEVVQGAIASVGLPVPLLSYVLATFVELAGGILLLVGYQTRIVSLVLVVFTQATAWLFHSNFADQNQLIHFLKNVAIAGGLLQVAAFGAGSFSLDARRLRAA